MEKLGNTRWFTNLDIAKRQEDLILYKTYNPDEYPKYDNYDAINVDKTKDIPVDYSGAMGVPITFLDKYNPEQFEIIWIACGHTRTSAPNKILEYLNYVVHPEDRGGCSTIKGKPTYARIIIKRI